MSSEMHKWKSVSNQQCTVCGTKRNLKFETYCTGKPELTTTETEALYSCFELLEALLTEEQHETTKAVFMEILGLCEKLLRDAGKWE